MKNHQSLQQPLLVLISGAPGSGKTTLATKLAQKTGLFHVQRDKLKLGIEFTSRTSPHDRKNTVIPVYFGLISALIDLGVSCIADGTHFHDATEHDLEQFVGRCTMINVHCYAEGHFDRAYAREQKAEIKSEKPDWLPEYKPRFEDMKGLAVDPVNHGLPVLEVDCTAEYKPDLQAIVDWVHSST